MKGVSFQDAFFAFIFFALLALAFEFWYLTLALACLYIGFKIYEAYMGSDEQQERIQQKRTHKLYRKVLKRHDPPKDFDAEKMAIDWASLVYSGLPDVHESIDLDLRELILDFYEIEQFDIAIPKPPTKCHSMEGARYRDRLGRLDAKHHNPAAKEAAAVVLYDVLNRIITRLPPIQTGGASWGTSPLAFSFDAREAIGLAASAFYAKAARDNHVFDDIREQLDRNICELSSLPYSADNSQSDKLIMPTEYQGADAAFAYLKHTPLLKLFEAEIPIAVSEESRHEHHWLVAATGHGKTQALSSMILDDIDRVRQGECSLIVIDSNDQLINEIAHLSYFAKGGALEDKLIVLNPLDDQPLALNLFDIGVDFSSLDLNQQDRLYNSLIEIYLYIIEGLLGDDFTKKQESLFRHVVRLLITIPGANLSTFIELMDNKDAAKYTPYIHRLSGQSKKFFETQFFTGQFNSTRPEIQRRLLAIPDTFANMFSAPKNAINLREEVDQGKVILINSCRDGLGDDLSRNFGRFFISLIWQLTKARFSEADARTVYVYIDEAVEYFDDKIGNLLRQARKSNVGLIMAHQDFEDVPSSVLGALRSNVAIRMAGGIESPQDRRAISKTLGLDEALIGQQTKGSFLTSVRQGITNTPIQFELGRLDREEKMSSAEYEAVMANIRARYYAPMRLPDPAIAAMALQPDHGGGDIDPLSGDDDFN